MTNSEEWYRGREQTLVKHSLLKDYLGALANIVGQKYSSITYVDCFFGPWKAASERYEDTSFGIAIAELNKARQQLKAQFNRDVEMRCFFIEKNLRAYDELAQFIDRTRAPGLELEAKNGRFENLIPEVSKFVQDKKGTFSFLFIDPRGWKPIAINTLKPLLQLRPGEVLINLMTSHLRRFIKTQNQTELFGSNAPIDRLNNLNGTDLDDEMVALYSSELSKEGGFQYVCAAIILKPSIDIPNYRLIYATRNQLGLAKFKEAEKRSMIRMQPARAEAKLRKDEERTGQSGLFPANEIYNSSYYQQLRDRYLSRSRSRVWNLLSAGPPVSYDDLWKAALADPLVFESDLKEWLRSNPRVRFSNLEPNERSPKVGCGHLVTLWATE
ncbi:MAG TPA: three-Cys-motif partner protein TcmP [Terriglobales bacterium]